jgi:hypothetical protein
MSTVEESHARKRGLRFMAIMTTIKAMKKWKKKKTRKRKRRETMKNMQRPGQGASYVSSLPLSLLRAV